MGFKEFAVRKEAAGGFGKGIMEMGTALAKSMEKAGPATVMKLLAYGLPIAAAMQLIDLEPTGNVIGEYLKNKLVPGLDESNKAREMELAAAMEMGTKHLPAMNADVIGYESGRDRKKLDVEKAMLRVPEIMDMLERNSGMPVGTDKSNIRKMITDMIQIAPVTVSENPSVLISPLRSAALMGTDTVDLQTVQQLADLERAYTGRR